MNKTVVVIFCYNVEENIHYILKSIKKTHLSNNRDFLFIDDCSSDNTNKILKSYKIKNSKIIENKVNPSFMAPVLIGADTTAVLSFDLIITDEEHISDTSSVSIEIVYNNAPTAVIGDYRNYNDGALETDRYLYGNFDSVNVFYS